MKYTKVNHPMANSSRTYACCTRQFPSSRMPGQILNWSPPWRLHRSKSAYKNTDVDQLFQPRSHLCNICGQSKPPKHILLSYGVKTLTENIELIQMLDRLDHGVSYCQLEKNDTALCLQKMAANLNQKLVLPGTIQRT